MVEARPSPSAATSGTVTVDVELLGALPKGARPDLSVDGVVELERLENVLYVGRPAQGQGESEGQAARHDHWASDVCSGSGTREKGSMISTGGIPLGTVAGTVKLATLAGGEVRRHPPLQHPLPPL